MRYLVNKKFIEYSYQALSGHFTSKKQFNGFFKSIKNDKQKNLFLKTASFYLFLVKKGDWLIDLPGTNTRVDYLTNTYKYIALFSLIESLHSKRFVDFYEYLIMKTSNVNFPIQNKTELDCHYRRYKKEFGSIQQSIKFFRTLSDQQQTSLMQKLEVRNTEHTIDNLAKYLYDLRSQFVHEAELIVNMSGRTTIGKRGKKIIVCKLAVADLMQFFEEGLLEHFKPKKK